ncbi:MAG TPA: NblA/ycf18 family protein [Crinalium sp.]|jgi:hypothetical protein
MENSPFDLTLEQQFQMKVLEESAQDLSLEQARSILVQTSRLLMLKDNVIRDLLKSCKL